MKSTVNFKCTWSTDTNLISRESEEHIYKKIGRLKGNDQKLVGMMIDGCSRGKMAKVMGCSENTVKTQVCRVRQALKKAI